MLGVYVILGGITSSIVAALVNDSLKVDKVPPELRFPCVVGITVAAGVFWPILLLALILVGLVAWVQRVRANLRFRRAAKRWPESSAELREFVAFGTVASGDEKSGALSVAAED